MKTVSLVTFCHPPRYSEKLHRPGVLRDMVESHKYQFDDVVVIHNKCKASDYPPFDYPCRTVDLPREEFEPLLSRFGINPHQPELDELTHGENAPHFWKCHVTNHLLGLEVVDTDYVVFADCDTWMQSQPEQGPTWVHKGIEILEKYPSVLIVSPGDGGTMAEAKIPEARLTRNVSQQLFICRRQQFHKEIDFDVPWIIGDFRAPGGPFQEFYGLLEGRLWRYMDKYAYWRAILPDTFRYWHDSHWGNN